MTIPGITFYDFINKMIPGTLLWSPWILKSCNCTCDCLHFEHFGILWYMIIFCGFYLTGILWEFLAVKLIFCWLRLRPCMLIKAKESYYEDAGKAAAALSNEGNEIKRDFIKAYYKGLKNNALRDLPILESHENFLKSIWLLICLYAVIAGISLSGIWQIVVLSSLIVAIGTTPFIWYRYQMKIYYLVWEAEDNIN